MLPNIAFNLVNQQFFFVSMHTLPHRPKLFRQTTPRKIHKPPKSQIRYHSASSLSLPFIHSADRPTSHQSNQGGASPFSALSVCPSTCFSRLATIEPLPSDEEAPLTSFLNGLRPDEAPMDLGRKGTGVVGREERNCVERSVSKCRICVRVVRKEKNIPMMPPRGGRGERPGQHPRGCRRPRPSAGSQKPCTRCRWRP